MKIEWLPEAERNFQTQIEYIAQHSPRAAIRVGDLIEAAVERLARYPKSGRVGRVQGTREQVVGGRPTWSSIVWSRMWS